MCACYCVSSFHSPLLGKAVNHALPLSTVSIVGSLQLWVALLFRDMPRSTGRTLTAQQEVDAFSVADGWFARRVNTIVGMYVVKKS